MYVPIPMLWRSNRNDLERSARESKLKMFECRCVSFIESLSGWLFGPSDMKDRRERREREVNKANHFRSGLGAETFAECAVR